MFETIKKMVMKVKASDIHKLEKRKKRKKKKEKRKKGVARNCTE